jgi:hypothetical protein
MAIFSALAQKTVSPLPAAMRWTFTAKIHSQILVARQADFSQSHADAPPFSSIGLGE